MQRRKRRPKQRNNARYEKLPGRMQRIPAGSSVFSEAELKVKVVNAHRVALLDAHGLEPRSNRPDWRSTRSKYIRDS